MDRVATENVVRDSRECRYYTIITKVGKLLVFYYFLVYLRNYKFFFSGEYYMRKVDLSFPVGKITEKAITWHCVLSAELTKNFFRLFFLAIFPTGLSKHAATKLVNIGRSRRPIRLLRCRGTQSNDEFLLCSPKMSCKAHIFALKIDRPSKLLFSVVYCL